MGLSHPSPNFGPRRGGVTPSLIVVHYTAMESAEAALARLCDPEAEVSCHWLVSDRGDLCSLVEEEMRAWHAGAGAWGAWDDVNSASIGIELDNDGASPFPEAQMAALEGLLDEIMGRWGIAPECVIGHSDMAPERKQDPGGRFDWRRLALAGRSVWPEAQTGGAYVYEDLRAFGYPSSASDDAVLAAFRARFRPGAQGSVAPEDRGIAADLARRFGVDRGAASA